MSVWAGLAKAKGLGQKKILIKTLTYGADGTEDISAATYVSGGILVRIRELEKVDFAVVNIMSGAAIMSATRAPIPIPTNYSANAFNLMLLTSQSGSGYSYGLGDALAAGMSISGVCSFHALIIGEGRKQTN
jgi:hypothetical protein